MGGGSLIFSEEQLKSCAEAYDPEVFKSPLVVGHPKLDDPAYGWVGALSFSDGYLEVTETDQLETQFAEMVNEGRFPKVSASFYLPDAPSNPKPGTLYLKHVGFLGAAAPAVKGLKTVSFSDTEEGIVEFTDWDQMTIANLFRRFREWIIGEKGIEVADKVFPEYEINSLQINAAQEDTRGGTKAYFSEPNEDNDMTPEQKAKMEQLEADNEKLTAENKKKDEQITAFAEQAEKDKKAATHADNVSFAEGLIKEGKLLPADKDSTVATLDQLAAAKGDVSFGEGDEKKTLTPLALHKEQLKKAPKIVEFGETHQADEEAGVASFSAASGYTVDTAQLELHNKASAYAAKNGVSYDEALSKVKQKLNTGF